MKKFRKNQSKLYLSENKLSKVDIWISRASHMSQVGILIIAVFGYFYTIVPIYQKSILDEDIAKKTLELNSLKESIYIKQRQVLINNLIHESSLVCSGLLERPKNPIKLGEKPLTIVEENPILFKNNSSKCFTNFFENSDLKYNLHKIDYEILSKNVAVIADNLEKDQSAAQNNFYRFTNAVNLNPDILERIILNIHSANMFEILKKIYPNEEFGNLYQKTRLEQAQFKIINDYRDKISTTIKELSKISWE